MSNFDEFGNYGIVESRKGAVALAPFPFPAHQTGRADFPHPAFRWISWLAHGGWLADELGDAKFHVDFIP